MKEIYKDIKDCPGYKISNIGNIISMQCPDTYKLLKPGKTKYGHQYVCIKKNSTRKHLYIHRLVAQTFISNPNNYPNVCHKDNNPLNNTINNLYWGTQKHNIDQAIKDGRYIPFKSYNKK